MEGLLYVSPKAMKIRNICLIMKENRGHNANI